MLDFPSSPSNGQTYTGPGGVVWQFDGTKWANGVSAASAVTPSDASPTMNGTAAAGTSALYSRGDHIHPTDTSRASVASVPLASSTTPVMDGTATIGAGTTWARADHIHPTDTSRYAATNPSGYQTSAQVTTSLGSYLPLAGGNVSGNLAVGGTMTVTGNTTTNAAFAPNGLYVGASGDTAFGMSPAAGMKRIQMISGYRWDWETTGGQMNWFAADTAMLRMRISDWLMFNQTGTVGGNGAYTNISDRRGKQDIAPATAGLAEILQLQPVTFRRVAPPNSTGRTYPDGTAVPDFVPRKEIGFVAQDVAPVLPQAVSVVGIELADGSGGPKDAEPSLALSESMITAVLVNAIKELNARLAALEGAAP